MGLHFAGRRALILAAVAVALGTVGLPSAAFASTKFSSKVPAASSTSTRTLPTISVYVTDTYGIKGAASFSMTIDGKKVNPTITYRKKGDYKRVTLSFRVVTALKVGAHTVVVKTKNIKKKTASTTWKFAVASSPLPPHTLPPESEITTMPISISATDCAACHVGYPASHRMTDCAGCHFDGAVRVDGRPMLVHGPDDESAHTLSCSLRTWCHGKSTVFPHVLDSDCKRCHTATSATAPRPHSLSAEPSHITSNTWCVRSGCHVASLTREHGRYSISGAKLTCATCHSSTDPRVVATIKTGATSCDGCHVLPASHPRTAASHTLATAPSCVGAACHSGGTSGTDVTAVHAGPGCGACHRADMAPSLTCGSCHTTDGHPSHTASAAPATLTIAGVSFGVHACTECHPITDLRTLHGGDTSCRKCHPTQATSAKPWLGGCVQGSCHTSGPLRMHATIDASHTLAVAPGCTAATCHTGGTSVAAIHAAVPGRTDSGCGICHAAGAAPTLVCVTCHPAGSTASHASHPAKITSGTVTINAVDYGKRLCTSCHATTELQAAHGGIAGCGKCHPSPRNTFTKWNGGCVQGACHAAGTALAMHGTADLAHVTVTAAACTGAGCHSGGRNVAAIHAALTGRTDSGCGICHAPGKTATSVCATAGCHPSGPPAIHASHPATITSGTLTVLGTSYGKHLCFECHAATELQAAHGGASSCAKCHPSPRGTFTKWSGGCVQGGCHAAGTALAMHGSIDTSHSAPAGSCVSALCHISNVVALHAPGRGCATCHAPGVTATMTCTKVGCHGTTDPHPAHPASLTTATFTIGGASFGTHACSECHASSDLRVLHGGDTGCASCHPSPRNSFTAWNHGCVQGNCHKAGTALAMHGSIDSSHTAVNGACVSSRCHAANVATLHAPGPGCAACHAAGKTPTLVCATAGCHPAGASASHASHPATITSGTITINGIDYTKRLCSECHATTELQAAHGGIAGCGKCHPAPRDSFTKWNGACVQGGCHVAGTTLAMHGSVNASHTVPAASGCTIPSCHTGGTDIAAIHDAVAGRSGSGCVLCHSAGTTATAVCTTTGCHPAATTALHASHPAKITSATISINGTSYGNHQCAECHATTELQAVHGGASSCAKCHPSPRGSITTWNGACVQGGCHVAGGALAMHGSIDASHTVGRINCAQAGCHNPDLAALHASGPGCGACHKPGQALTLDCLASTCHPRGADLKHSSHPALITTGTITILGTGYPGQKCADCHPSMELEYVHGAHGSCVKCHPSPRNSFTTWSGGCVQGACHAPGTPLAMHASVNASHTALTAPSCTLSDCHAGGSDVAKIHAAKGGCADCHGTGKVPSLDCTTCHDDDLVTAHAAYVGTNHQVSSASCVVGACHAGQDAAQLHAASVGCAACHTKSGPASVECLNCHRLDIAARHPSGTLGHTYNTHPCNSTGCHLANSAAVHAFTDHSCGVCHKPTGTTGSACTNCHTYAWASRHTAYSMSGDYHGSTAGTGSDIQGQGFYSTGWILAPYTRGNAPSPNANLACSVCHDPVGSRNYYNFPNVVNGHAVTVTSGFEYVNLCVACHGGTVDQWHAGCFSCHTAGHGSTPGWTVVGRNCSQCHKHANTGWPHSMGSVTGPTL